MYGNETISTTNSSIINTDVSNLTEPQCNVAFGLILIIQSVIIVSVNIFLILTIVRIEEVFRKHSTKIFINLQICHILNGIFYTLANYRYNLVYGFVVFGIVMELFLSMIMLTIDRYCAVRYPMMYLTLERRYHLTFITSSWMLTITLTTLGMVFYRRANSRHIFLVLNSFLFVIMNILVITSVMILWQIYKSKRFLNTSTIRNSLTLRKATNTCLLIVFSFVLSSTPYFIHNIMVLINDQELNIESGYKKYSVCFGSNFAALVVIIQLCDSIADPILFIANTPKVRRRYKRTLRRLRNKHRVEMHQEQDTSQELGSNTNRFTRTTFRLFLMKQSSS